MWCQNIVNICETRSASLNKSVFLNNKRMCELLCIKALASYRTSVTKLSGFSELVSLQSEIIAIPSANFKVVQGWQKRSRFGFSEACYCRSLEMGRIFAPGGYKIYLVLLLLVSIIGLIQVNQNLSQKQNLFNKSR